MNLDAIRKFMKNEKAAIKRSIFLDYIDDIKYLLEMGYNRRQVYEYLEEQYSVKVTIKAFYKFLEKQNLKPNPNPPKEQQQEAKTEKQLQSQQQQKEQTTVSTEPTESAKNYQSTNDDYKNYYQDFKKSKRDVKYRLGRSKFFDTVNFIFEKHRKTPSQLRKEFYEIFKNHDTRSPEKEYVDYISAVANLKKENKEPIDIETFVKFLDLDIEVVLGVKKAV